MFVFYSTQNIFSKLRRATPKSRPEPELRNSTSLRHRKLSSFAQNKNGVFAPEWGLVDFTLVRKKSYAEQLVFHSEASDASASSAIFSLVSPEVLSPLLWAPRFNQTIKMLMSAGETPEIREA
jgi:hypothetical protein